MKYICLSLISRPDRQAHAREVFTRWGILDKVEWWIVEKHPIGGLHGCFESHWTIWSKHNEDIWVFEDDVDGEKLPDIPLQKLISNFDPWIIFLAPRTFYTWGPTVEGFREGAFATLTSYIVPGKHIKQLTDHVEPYFGISIDLALLNVPMIGRKVLGYWDSNSDIIQGRRHLLALTSAEDIFSKVPNLGKLIIDLMLYTRSNPLIYKKVGKLTDRRICLRLIENGSNGN